MTSCSLKFCTSRTTKMVSGVSFFQFPQDVFPEREKWIKYVQEERSESCWLPSKFSKLCSKHFSEEYIVRNAKKSILKIGAVPGTSLSELVKTEQDMDGTCSPISECVSDESILDSPKKIQLKKSIVLLKNKEILNNKSIKKLRQQVSKLKRQNKNLNNKVINLSNLVKILNGKFNLENDVDDSQV